MALLELLQVITLLVLGAGLAAYAIQARELVRQTRLLNTTNRAMVSYNSNAMMHNISTFFLQYPQLRRYFYDNAPMPSEEPTRTQVLVLADMFLDLMSVTLNNAPLQSPEEASGWREYFRDLAKSSPALCDWWAQCCHWYEPPMHSLLDDIALPPTDGEQRFPRPSA